jgi:hypothetical protein
MDSTATTGNQIKCTKEMLNEALKLIRALTPKQTPDDVICIRSVTGLSIIKSDMLPANSVMVSKELFDLIYESSASTHETNGV